MNHTLDRRTALRGALALAGGSVLAAAGTTAPAFAAYTPNGTTTGGSGGPLTDQNFGSYTDKRGVNAGVHRRAAHLSAGAAVPLVIHLHGDGGYEYQNPTVWTAPKYAQVARDYGALFLLPQSPFRADGYTWWRNYGSTQWLADLIGWAGWRYNIDRRRIFVSGFSGGAQVASHNLVADYHSLFLGGGAMMLGGGGIQGMSITGTPSAAVKANFLMRWHVGDQDTAANSPERFDAVRAATIGRDTFRAGGWNTRLTLIPGEGHNASEDNGPAALRSLLAESFAR